MLILRRKIGDSIRIDDKITVVVNRVSGNRVSLGIDAPPEVRVVRGELPAFSELDRQSGKSSGTSQGCPAAERAGGINQGR